MQAAGPVIWLRAAVATIERQIATDPTTRDRRPDLTAAGGRREIESLLALREPLYRQTATWTVDIDGRTIDEIVADILPGIVPAGRRPSGPRGSSRP